MTAERARHILNAEVGFEKYDLREAAELVEGLGVLLNAAASMPDEGRMALLEDIEDAEFEVLDSRTLREPLTLLEIA